MNVLKFGGTSVGSPESILSVKNIVSSRDESVIVVVSALGGVTDLLLKASSQAGDGDVEFRSTYALIRRRHLEMLDAIFEPSDKKDSLTAKIESLLESLGALYEGVFTLRLLPE